MCIYKKTSFRKQFKRKSPFYWLNSSSVSVFFFLLQIANIDTTIFQFNIYIYIYICVCVWVCARVCACVCVCVCNHNHYYYYYYYYYYYKGGRGLASTEDSVDALIQWLEDYIEKRRGKLITATRINTEKTRINRMEITRKQKENNSLIDYQATSHTIRHWRNVNRGIESLLVAAQNNAIRTNHIKARRCPWCSRYHRRK